MLADDLRSIAEWMGQQEWIDHDPEFAACMWARAAILQSIAARLAGRVVVKPRMSTRGKRQHSANLPYATVYDWSRSPEEALDALQALLDKED